jgi:hypothetical protein
MERARDRKFADSPLEHAVASLMSDLHKHADTHPTLEDIQDGTRVLLNRDRAQVRRWIEGFR